MSDEPKEVRTRIFKSGNSYALRIPKSMGLTEGTEIVLREQHRKFTFMAENEMPRKIDVSGFWGKAPGARLIPQGDFDERPSAIAARKAQELQ